MSLGIKIENEVQRLQTSKLSIANEIIQKRAYVLLAVIIVLNVIMIWYLDTDYLLFWVASSLYFYLFYPLLPLMLFPFRYISERSSKKTEVMPKEKQSIHTMLNWAVNLHIFQNKKVGYHLFMRFFLLNLIPITSGIIFIYGVSLISTIIIKIMTNLTDQTLLFIIVQCFGIISFYSIVFIFRGNALYRTHQMVKMRLLHHRRMLLLAAIAIMLIIVSTVLVILMIIAMLMPAYTLNMFINMVTFSNAGKNVAVIFVLVSQFFYMQFLQSHLSRKISDNFLNDLISRLNNTRDELNNKSVPVEGKIKKAERLILECSLYSFNKRRLFGLFPSFSIGVSISNLLKVTSLSQLSDIFTEDECNKSIIKGFLI
jgi:hypothetical protein